MTERKQDQYAPIQGPYKRFKFQNQAQLISQNLWNRYKDAHADRVEYEMRRFNDGLGWQGPVKFALPIYLVQTEIPNERVLRAVTRALEGIVEWPNARGQAYQIGRCVKWGSYTDCFKEIAQIGHLIGNIAEQKPYGEKTVGTNLLQLPWNDMWFEGNLEDRAHMKDLLTTVVGNLASFNRGDYLGCLQDYPYEPFGRLRRAGEDSLFSSPADREAYVAYLIRERYPILVEQPALAKRLLGEFNLSKAE